MSNEIIVTLKRTLEFAHSVIFIFILIKNR